MPIFTVYFDGYTPVPIANFFSRDAAEACVRALDDEVECAVHVIAETPLIDLYGYPIPAREYPAAYDRLIGE